MPETTPPSPPRPGGRPTKHGLTAMRHALRVLTTKRLDGRSAVAVAVRKWKADVRADLGGDLTRAQATVLESAAQKLILRDSLGGWLLAQGSLVTKKRTCVPVLRDYLQVTDSLARDLERLGLERRASALDVAQQFAALHDSGAEEEDGDDAPRGNGSASRQEDEG